MADNKFEDVKKEIRSLLISYQKGTSLSDFNKEYRGMIGRRLPFHEFGFNDEFSFLKAMPDVVKIYPSPVHGDYHLMGVADESVKHIQKMVCKQKTSKHRTRYRAPRNVSYAYSSAPSYASNFGSSRSHSNRYELPPRFNKKELPNGVDSCVIQMLNNYPYGVKLSSFLEAFRNHYKREFKFREWGFATLEECLETIPEINARNKSNEIIIHLVKSNVQRNQQARCAPAGYAVVSKDNQLSRSHSRSSISESSALNPNAPDFFDRNFNKNENISHSEKKTNVASEGFSFDKNKCDSPKVKSTTASIDNFSINANKYDSPTSNSTSSDNFLINRMIQDSYSHSVMEENSCIEESFDDKNRRSSNTYASSSLKINDPTDQFSFRNSKADLLDDFPLINFKEEPAASNLLCDTLIEIDDKDFNSPLIKEPEEASVSGVSRLVRNNLIKMIANYPHGMIASNFSSCYEKVTNTKFDLHSLGFNNLHELVDSVPDIMVRKPFAGSKKDWIIYSAKSEIIEDTNCSGPAECNVLFVESIILNIRKILQANPEGIPVSNFIHHYSINCTEPLYIRDLGFGNLEDFLLSIASRVPLEIITCNSEKTIMLASFQGTIKPPVSTLQRPADIAPLDAKYKPYELPSDFDYSKFYVVYTSSIANPGLLYIQFDGEETSEALKSLYNKIEEFYNSDESDSYRMKPADIKPNVSCIALWPDDRHWYRVTIHKIVSIDFVLVFYVDYGTTDEIPMHMLRYIKKDYMALPAQAIKSRLAYLKPVVAPGQVTGPWDKRTRTRMLELCNNRPLMAKVENICRDGVLALILCDTNVADKDLFINDTLINEKLAVVCGEKDEYQLPNPTNCPIVPDQNLQPMLEMMAKLMTSASNPDLMNYLQNFCLPNQMVSGVMPQQSLPPMYHQFPNITPLVSPNLSATIPNFGSSLNFNDTASIKPPKYPPGLNIQIPQAASNSPKKTDISVLSTLNPSPPLTPSLDDGDIFDDDDDEYFEQLCRKNVECKTCHVKRVKTADGYVFHVLLFDSQPHISSGDLSILIWPLKNPSYLFHKLQAQEVELPSMTLMENGNEEFFVQLEKYKVKGIERMGSESSVLLYPLSKANKILNLFGHPSATLRAKINTEVKTFNPASSYWLELPDNEIPEVEDIRMVTDDDKMNRLCLYDLKTMREGIRCKRLKLVKKKEAEKNNCDLDEEINKLNQLSNKVRERIIEIEQIIAMFSESKH